MRSASSEASAAASTWRSRGPFVIVGSSAAIDVSETAASSKARCIASIRFLAEVIERSVDDVVAATFSLSSSTPYLFGEHSTDFEKQLRALLETRSDDGLFCERVRDIAFDVRGGDPVFADAELSNAFCILHMAALLFCSQRSSGAVPASARRG